ncbi:MAG: TonB-dependent receptor [Acidobacteria bacterium]|nr:TonB-dependent receptor [Acidobacteriota bacterium]
MSRQRDLFRLAARFVLAGLSIESCLAQTSAGSISGVISDSAGAVIPAAEVKILNTATGVSRQTVSNDTGYFTFTGVLPAIYELNVSAKGFKAALRKGLELQVGQALRSDVQLEVGDLVQTVEIQSASPLLESTSTKIGTAVETKQVTELPLNGRQFGQLILLTPGALPIALGQSTAFKVQLGAGSYSPVINGQRSRYNNFTLDGVENNDPMFNSYAMNPSVDAIQEFSVQSRGGVTEQGRSMGSDIVVVTRSGTNQYRGTLFEFLRNTKLDARNFFDPVRPTFKQNQFGGTFGGPVRLPKYNGRDRTFFFGYYEGFQFVRASNSISTVPTAAMADGDFTEAGQPVIYDILTTRADSSVPGGSTRSVFPGNRLPAARINALAQNLIKSVYPPTNAPGITRNFVNTNPTRQEADQASARIDHRISGSNSLFGRITYNDGYNSTPGGIPAVSTFLTNTAWNATVSDTHIFRPNLIGHFQWGFNRYTSNRKGRPLPDSILQAATWDKVFPSGPPDLLMLSLGITDLAGAGGSFTPIGPHNYYQNVADLTWIKGKHSFKTGLTISYLNSFQASPQASIGFSRRPTSNLVDLRGTGHGAATFLLGLPTDARRAAGDTSAKLSQFEYHGFLQDEFRASKNLTITAGLRYSYVQSMKEARNAYSGLDVLTGNYLLAVKNPVTGAGPNLRQRWVDPDWNNFSPRIGIAYLLGQITTIRAGAGIYYSFTDFVQYYADPAGNWPFGFSETVGPLNDFNVDSALTNPFSASAGARLPQSPEGQGGYAMNPRMKTPYSTQWNFSIQRQLPGEFLLDLSYVGSNSVKLLQTRVENQAIPGPGPVQPRRPLPNYTAVNWDDNGPPSNYNGFSVKFQKRFGSGLSFLTSSTWGHNLDVFSTERGGTTGGPQDPLNWRPDYASSTADMRLNWLFSNVYELPFGKGKRWLTSGIPRYVLGNWQWSNIVALYGGQPVNVSLGFDNASLGRAGGQRPNVSGSPLLSGSERTRLRWFNTRAFSAPAQLRFGNAGRNLFRGPMTKNYDTSIAKNFPIGERRSLQFRAELFNAFNAVNFGAPVSSFSSQDFGVILSARASRSVQFSLKLAF